MEKDSGSKKYAPLPQPLTTLIGREEETTSVCNILRTSDVRLLTLVGMGGVGKTRLALHVAHMLWEDFDDQVMFVPLAVIYDPLLVLPIIAQMLGLSATEQQITLEAVQKFLGNQRVLLILDNFEHLLNAAPQLEELLVMCPHIKLLITSRTALRIQGEHTFPVLPLEQPDLEHIPSKELLMRYPAIALFVQRVQAVLPNFQFTDENAHTIAVICIRLDGLPLALELAAARIKLFPPQALLKRLSHRLHVLDRGLTTLPERQQTLRATLQWSYDLLSADEQWLFRLLSVFIGGCTLDAIEAVCQQLKGETFDVINTVASLLDHSLIQQTSQNGDMPRLNILETVREYGQECLLAKQELEASKRSHAIYYLSLAEAFARHRRENGSQISWIDQLVAEQENLRAALHFFIEQKDANMAVRLSAALQWYWITRGSFNEGRSFLEAALALPYTGTRTPALAKALCVAGELALRQGSYAIARSLQEESVATYQQLDDKRGLAEAQLNLGLAYAYQEHFTEARPLIESGIALSQEIGDSWLLGFAWDKLARLEWKQGNIQEARALCEEVLKYGYIAGEIRGQISPYKILAALAIAEGDDGQASDLAQKLLVLSETIDDQESQFTAFFLLGDVAKNQGDQVRALDCYQKSLIIAQAMDERRNQSMVFARLGDLSYRQGKYEEAMLFYRRSVQFARPFEEPAIVGWSLLGLARIARTEKRYWRAATLLGAGEACLNLTRDLNQREREAHECDVMVLHTYLGEEAYTRACQVGRNMTSEQALNLPVSEPDEQARARPKYPDGLTEREVEILLLVSLGLTDAQVAEKLVISPRTVQGHLRSIYNKIDVTSRNAATRYALDHKLI